MAPTRARCRAGDDGTVHEGLRVRLMGGLTVDGMTDREIGSRKARLLLAVLAVSRGEPVSVDHVADVLWGDDLPARPADQVGVLVSRLRSVIGADRIVRRASGYALEGAWLDVDEIEQRVDEASTAYAAGRLAAARAAADAALALVRGALLDGEDGDWVLAARERAGAAVAAARRVKVEAGLAAGDWPAVVAQAEAMLADHPYDEAVLRALMRAHALGGSTAAALAAYARARARFADDLGVSPSAETEELHARLLVETGADGERAEPTVDVPVDAPATLPGRRAERELLDRALAGARRGRPTVVAVEGEAGIGKTAIVETWLDSLDAGSALVVVGRCDALGRDLPLGPVADALATAVRMAPPEALDRVPDVDAWLLASVVGIGAAPPDPPAVPPALEQVHLFSALLRCLSTIADDRLPVLAIDDVHDADAATIAWLDWAARRAERLLLVVSRRPGGPHVEGERTLHVGPLDVDAVAELAGTERAAELHARSGGHPLLLRAMLAAGTGGEIPSTIRAAVDRELAALGDGAGAIRAAAVLGPEVDVDALAAVQHMPVAAVLDALDAAAAAGLLQEADHGYRFRHDLIRAAVESQVTSARRAHLHREAARTLAQRPRVDPLRVALHARHGRDDELAAIALADAAGLAARRYDLDRADELLGESLRLAPAASTLLERARLRMGRGDHAGAAADARDALVAGAGAAGYELLGWIAYYRRDYDAAAELVGDALGAATDQVSRAGPLVLSARVLHGRGDLAAALDRFADAEGGPPASRQVSAVWHANALLHAGRPRQALALLERAVHAPPGPHPFAPLHAHWALALALAHVGRLADASAALDQLDALIERSGDVGERLHGPARNVRGYLLRQSGCHAEADEQNVLARECTSGPDGAPSAQALEEAYWVAHLDLAEGRLAVGDLAGAADLEAAMAPMDAWTGTMAWHQRHRLDLLRARLAAVDGERDRAHELASQVATDARARRAHRYAALAEATAVLVGDGGDLAAAEAAIDELRSSSALEAWRVAAALGQRFDVRRWTALAERHAGELIRLAGEQAPALRAEAARLLG